jgi:hypothetical protein
MEWDYYCRQCTLFALHEQGAATAAAAVRVGSRVVLLYVGVNLSFFSPKTFAEEFVIAIKKCGSSVVL